MLRNLLRQGPEKDELRMLHTLDGDGINCLMLAARNGHAECVSELLKVYEASQWVNDRSSKYERTALTYAVVNGHIECVKRLAQYPAIGVDEDDASFLTPIFYATLANNVECVKILLKHGACPYSEMSQGEYCGESAVSIARKNCHLSILSLFRDDEKAVKQTSSRPTVRKSLHKCIELEAAINEANMALKSCEDAHKKMKVAVKSLKMAKNVFMKMAKAMDDDNVGHKRRRRN